MAMDTVTATNTVIAIPTSITMVMAMGMEETKIKKCMTHFCPNKKPPQCGGFFMNVIFIFRKIILVEILEWTPIVSLAF